MTELVETIDITRANFINPEKFKIAPISDTTNDWRRSLNRIYINGEKLIDVINNNNLGKFNLPNQSAENYEEESVEKPEEYQKTFLKILDYLLQYINDAAVKKKFSDFIIANVHQSGPLLSLLNSFFSNTENDTTSKNLAIPGRVSETARIDFFCDGNILLIKESLQINTLAKINNIEPEILKKPEGNFLEYTTEYSIRLNSLNNCELKLEKALVKSYDPEIKDRLLKKYFLTQYVNNYLDHGNDNNALRNILDRYPEIPRLSNSPSSKMFSKKIDNNLPIFQHVSNAYPAFAEDLVKNIGQYAKQGEYSFLRAIHLLIQVGQKSLAEKAIEPFVKNKEMLSGIVGNDKELMKICRDIRENTPKP